MRLPDPHGVWDNNLHGRIWRRDQASVVRELRTALL
jgi:hypothetical protein